MPTKARHRPTLKQGLDREVFQIVRKYIDTHSEGPTTRISSSAILDWIKRSNSSLKRRPNRILEDSIDRVLEVIQEEESASDEMQAVDGDFGSKPDDAQPDHTCGNIMNKSIVSSWGSQVNNSPAPNGSGDGDGSKKRESQRTSKGEPARKKKKEDVDRSPPTHIRLEDVGGVDNIKRELKEHLVLPLLWPEEYVLRKIPIPRGILLHGPPGCGKTAISRAFAAKLGVPFIEILGPSIVSGMSGESEKQIRDIFDEARRLAPCLIFIDEIDVIAPKRETSQSQMEKRIVAQLLVSLDALAADAHDGKPVIVLAATNRPDSIDTALRRGGRFDTEINMGVPNEAMREQILRAQTRDVHISQDVDFARLAKMTPGFVGADLRDLVGKAGTWSMDRFRVALEKQAAEAEGEMDLDSAANNSAHTEDISITRLIDRVRRKDKERPQGFEDTSMSMEAFLTVLPSIQPSSKREGFATIPDTTWTDIGALSDIREQLAMAVVEPIKNPHLFEKVGISTPAGVLLWGPPGCGKTLLAKAVANESKANFISIKGPELLNKYVGESERAVRQVFQRARSSVPCIVFFDELDALAARREDSHSEASSRVVNTLLTEMDGLSARAGIHIIGATNRPDIIDDAMLRPGRLESLLYIGLPGPSERSEILRALIRKTPIDESLADFGKECDGYSGADLSSLLRKAGQNALKRGSAVVEKEDFKLAHKMVRVSVADVSHYEALKGRFAEQI